jgi:hypothetical protein
LQLERNKSASCFVAKSALAGFLVALILGYCALAASPSLHELFHHDAGSSDHNCFITFFARGQITPAASMQSTDYCFSPSRAPPVFSRF